MPTSILLNACDKNDLLKKYKSDDLIRNKPTNELEIKL